MSSITLSRKSACDIDVKNAAGQVAGLTPGMTSTELGDEFADVVAFRIPDGFGGTIKQLGSYDSGEWVMFTGDVRLTTAEA